MEHLRTVHFALIAISVGLILLLSSKPYDAAVALTQVDEILQLKGLWSSEGLLSAFPSHDETFILRPAHTESVREITDFEGIVTFSKIATTGERSAIGNRLHFHIPSPMWYSCQALVGKVHHPVKGELGNPRWGSVEFPNRVIGFKKWWSDLRVPYNIFVVNDVLPAGKIIAARGSSHPDTTIGSVTFSPSSLIPSKSINLNLIGGGCKQDWMKLYANETLYVFVFDVVGVRRVELNRDVLHERFGDWKSTGTFDEVFPDLAKAVRRREGLDWSTLQRMISDEASRSRETFDAFGIKFPVEQVTVWGMVVLLPVQLYLFMYLKRLSNKLYADDPGWDMPWIAMDESKLARFMFFLSLVLLPCSAAALVTTRALFQWVSEGWTWHILTMLKNVSHIVRAEMILMVLAFCASVALGILSWRCRPRLNMHVASPQLFE